MGVHNMKHLQTVDLSSVLILFAYICTSIFKLEKYQEGYIKKKCHIGPKLPKALCP